MEGEASSFNAAQVAVLAKIASGTPLPDALEAIVRLIEQQADGMLCSVLLLDAEHGCLRHGAAPSLPHDYVVELDGTAIGPEAGSCGTAAYRGERVIVEDIATHPYWTNYRHLALPHGLVACWSTPIISPDGAVLGTFAMYYRERRAPSSQELIWVSAATHLASIAIVRTQVEHRMMRSEARARKLARLYAVSSSVSETLVRVRDPVQVYEAACQIAVEGGVAVLAWVGIYHQADDRVEPVARFGADAGYIAGYGRHAGPAVRAIRTGTVAISNDIANDPTFHDRDAAVRRGLGACAAFPFRVGGPRRAVFVIYRDASDSFTEEASVLGALADNISFAIQSAENELERLRAEQALRDREERLRLLHDLGEAMRGAGDAEQVLAVAVRMLGHHLRVSRCGYAEIDDDGDRFTIAPDYTDRCASIAGQHRMSELGPEVSAALLRRRAAVVRDVDTELTPGPGIERLKALGIRASISCTLLRQGVPRAMMAVQQTEPRAWTRDDIRIVQEVGERCWSMIEQRTAETKLHRNEAMLRIAGRAARLGGWSLDVADRRLTWSDEVCAIHEIPAGSSPSLEQAVAFYTPDHRDTIRDAVRACARDGTAFDLELELVIAGDRRLWVRAIGNAERNSSGAVVRVHGAFQDISERRQLEDQLRQAQKMEAVGRLASAVAHDFNNVLSVILSYSSFLLDVLKPGDPVRGDVEEIQKAGDRASQLTRQLLAFSRQQILQPRVIAPDRIMAGLETMLRRLVGASVVLSIHTARSTGHIVADPGQLEQVLMNLVVNARDAMPAGGNLTVEIADVELDAGYATRHPGVAAGPYVMLAVADTGVGMDAATRQRIFEPFFTTKRVGEGTGLGLSTVYGIVNQSGGHIEVDSEPGHGTVFKVYFPRVDAAVEVALFDDQPIVLRGTETVLLVEDDDQVRKIVGQTLRRAGYFVFEAQNAGDALHVSERYTERIHLLLTDVVMPRIGGRELAERLVQVRRDLRVLYVSGFGQDALIRDGALAGDVAYLSKPITPDALLRRVREMLDDPSLAGRHDATPAEPMAARSSRRSTPPSGSGRHVLHIDDEESLVLLTARILKRLGYQVSSFTDPAQALAAFAERPASFDAVVTDVTMRRMTGFELVRAIWAIRADIPVVVTSGDFRPEDIRTADAMRIRDLVVKPDTVEELGRVLHELFSRPALR